MAHYSRKYKESMVRKVLSNPDISAKEQAENAGIGYSTLTCWIRKYSGQMDKAKTTKKSTVQRPLDWSHEERFEALLETAHLTDEGKAAYCRRRGIYTHHLEKWKAAFVNGTRPGRPREPVQVRELKMQNKALKRDLRRKEKALAETAALLILKKKADLIWGVDEDA